MNVWQLLSLAALLTVITACGSTTTNEPTASAPAQNESTESAPSEEDVQTVDPVEYTIVDAESGVVAGRKRVTANILAPNATTFEQRGETIIAAAKDLQESESADVVAIFMIPSEKLIGEGVNLALVRYAPDGKGFSGDQDWTWEVQASQESVDPQAFKVRELFVEKSPEFQMETEFGPAVDEEAVTQAIADELGITVDEVDSLFIESIFTPEDYSSPSMD
jgi:hypothetical protein